MKAKAFYSAWNREVSEHWSTLGLRALEGPGSRWAFEFEERLLLLAVVVDSKQPWTVEGGGSFSLHAYLPEVQPSAPEAYRGELSDSVWCFTHLDEGLVAQLYELNRKFCEKLRGMAGEEFYARMAERYDCTPQQARDSGLHATALAAIESAVDVSIETLVNPALRFYDVEDVARWTQFFQESMPRVLAGIQTEPRYVWR